MTEPPRPELVARTLRESLGDAGAVGEDLLAVDWASTPLGPIESWPQSLAAAVRTLLTSRFSMWMAWGPALTFFCNEAYRRDTLASKYPWALGRPASEVWAGIWPDIGPRIDTVMTTGESTWDEALLLLLERSGYPEETYHTFSYSPLTDDEGRVAGRRPPARRGRRRRRRRPVTRPADRWLARPARPGPRRAAALPGRRPSVWLPRGGGEPLPTARRPRRPRSSPTSVTSCGRR